MATPAQNAYFVGVWIATAAFVYMAAFGVPLFANLLPLIAARALTLFLLLQIGGPTLLMSIPQFIYFRRMSAKDYLALDHCLRRIIRIWPKILFGSGQTLTLVKMNWGINRIWLGDTADGELSLRASVQLVEQKYAKKRLFCGWLLYNNLAYAILKNGGSLDDAERAAEKSIELLRDKQASTDSPYAIFPFTNLGVASFLCGDYPKSETRFLQALASPKPLALQFEVYSIGREITKTNAQLWLTMALFKQSKNQEALRLAEEICERISSQSDFIALECLESLSLVARELADRNHSLLAEGLLDAGYALALENPDFLDNRELLRSYEQLLLQTNRASEVADLKRWIRSPAEVHLKLSN